MVHAHVNATPDLPSVVPVGGGPASADAARELRPGCWLISYAPVGAEAVHFDGALRVERHDQGRTASGDLYQRRVAFVGFPRRAVLEAGPKPSDGVPVLPRDRYRFYLSVTSLLEGATTGNAFTLGFELWRFKAPASWTREGAHTAQMTWIPAPSGYPSAADYLEGDVRNSNGVVVSRLKMGWVSPFLRRASLELDAVAGCERPLDNGAGVGWTEIFNAVGWDVRVTESDLDVAEPSGESWSDAEMHKAMLARRQSVDLDKEWRYHLLAVKQLDSTPRGIMYDAEGSDSNKVPREGVGISTHWMIPDTDEWGQSRNQRFGSATAPFFRTAVHELGHALGLFHNSLDNCFMNTTDVIASRATPHRPFPSNINWAFAPDDQKRLRHYPDVFVRPGGSAFGTASSTSPAISPTDLEVEIEGLQLRVTPVLEEAPIGAPVRVRIELVNVSETPHRTPATLSLKTDFVRGWVEDSAGVARSFSPMIRCIEDCPMRTLEPGESIVGDMTLLRGRDGPLFPASGLYTIVVEVHWEEDVAEATVKGSATLLVTGAQDAGHAQAAHRVLASPDAHVVLVVGGEHLEDGLRAIQAALDNPVLAPHFAVIEAKRLARLPGAAEGRPQQIAELLTSAPVCSEAEVKRLGEAVGKQGRKKGVADLVKAVAALEPSRFRPAD